MEKSTSFNSELENQIGQIARILSETPQGGLLSNTEINMKKQVKAMTLGSGKKVEKDEIQIERKVTEEENREIEVEHTWFESINLVYVI